MGALGFFGFTKIRACKRLSSFSYLDLLGPRIPFYLLVEILKKEKYPSWMLENEKKKRMVQQHM